MDIQLSDDPMVIQQWAKECLANKLYRADGVAQFVFAGDGCIYLMGYIHGVAWAMYHDLHSKFTSKSNIIGSVFVKPEYRHQGIGRRISDFVWKENQRLSVLVL